MSQFAARHHQPPRVILARSKAGVNVLLTGATLKKCREAEAVLKAHLYILKGGSAPLTFLSEEEVQFLGGWDAEKHRQKV